MSGKYLKINPEDIQFDYSEFGKPFFKAAPSLKFNLSHSGERIVIAFCHTQEVGVDIEKIKYELDVLELAQNFFSKTEIVALEEQPLEELPKSFFRCWTRKEAFIKAEGSGLSFPFDKFTVSIEKDNQAALLSTDWDESDKLNWTLFSFVPDTEYIGALAVCKKKCFVKYFNWNIH